MTFVLVVDDEYGVSNLLEDVLVDGGHRVKVAHNGRQALAHIAEERPAIVLTDFMMPVMDGAALVQAMKADQALASIPIMIMSSVPEATVAERCSGYAIFIRKPFSIFEVVELVDKLIAVKP